MPDISVLFHDNCIDGTTSAMLAYRALGDTAEYIPVRYGHPPPDVTGKVVYILDFCYDEPTTRHIIDQAKSLTVLDHHKSAQKAMQELIASYKDNVNVHIEFDMERSGAGLCRDYFGIHDMPLVDYVEDRDLWRFKLPDSKTVNAFIGTIPRTIPSYLKVFQDTPIDEAKQLGKGAEQYLEMYVTEVSKTAKLVSFEGYDKIPCVNAPYVGISELVGALAQNAPFALGYQVTADGYCAFSLRSRGEVDVSVLAERHGGGGHRGSAGFGLPLDKALEIIK